MWKIGWSQIACRSTDNCSKNKKSFIGRKTKKARAKERTGKNRRDHAGPAQQAHQLKRSRFQVFMNRVAINKEFFMEFIRDPSLRKPCGMLRLLNVLQETRTTRTRGDQDQCWKACPFVWHFHRSLEHRKHLARIMHSSRERAHAHKQHAQIHNMLIHYRLVSSCLLRCVFAIDIVKKSAIWLA